MRMTFTKHQANCSYEYAWDVADELGAGCNCKFPYPFKACMQCHKRWTKRHKCKI